MGIVFGLRFDSRLSIPNLRDFKKRDDDASLLNLNIIDIIDFVFPT